MNDLVKQPSANCSFLVRVLFCCKACGQVHEAGEYFLWPSLRRREQDATRTGFSSPQLQVMFFSRLVDLNCCA